MKICSIHRMSCQFILEGTIYFNITCDCLAVNRVEGEMKFDSTAPPTCFAVSMPCPDRTCPFLPMPGGAVIVMYSPEQVCLPHQPAARLILSILTPCAPIRSEPILWRMNWQILSSIRSLWRRHPSWWLLGASTAHDHRSLLTRRYHINWSIRYGDGDHPGFPDCSYTRHSRDRVRVTGTRNRIMAAMVCFRCR